MSETFNLGLPFIDGAQAQKHVTHNEALRKLDVHIHAHVLRRDLTSPPATPQEGDAYLIASNAIGLWLTHDNEFSVFQDGAWTFSTLKAGFTTWISSDEVLSVWSGTDWLDFVGAGVVPSQVDIWGVNATPDSTNKLSVSSEAILFNHVGSSVQHKLNKNMMADTASIVLQNGFSGRAEIGLVGDDDVQVKVSPDGATWQTALKIDKASGTVTMPAKPLVCLSRNSDLSWGSNTTEKVSFEVRQELQGDISVDAANEQVTINQDGLYLIIPHIVLSSQVIGSGDGWGLDIFKNGSKLNPPGSGTFAPNGFASNGSEMIATYTMIRPLVAGDYIEVYVRSIQTNAKCIGASLDIAHFG